MFNYRFLAIFKRELKERIFSKSFIIGTLALPFFMGLIIGVQYFAINMKGDTGIKLLIVNEDSSLTTKIEQVFSAQPWVKNEDYTITCLSAGAEEFQKLLEEKKAEILDDKLSGIVFIPKESLKDKKLEIYTEGTKNITLEGKIGGVLNQVFIDNYFKDKDTSIEDIQFARKRVEFNTFKVTKTDIEKETGGNLVLTYLFSIMLYISLLIMGGWIMQSVLEEKSNRICEVILSSVNSMELMTGKIMGAAFMGLLQMIIWLLPVFVIITFDLPVLPAGLSFQVEPLIFVYFLINFLIGLITFVGLYATVGSIFNNAQEAQSGVMPIVLLIMIPFFITMTLIKNPTNVYATVSSLLPFFSIIVMPARLTLNAVPIWQVILSFVINIGTILAIFPVAGKIYRVGILRTGKKPSFKELIKWLKEA